MDERLDAAPFGLRARKHARTRAALADALETALRTKDFVDVTVEELAAAADVSRATFFNYFDSKNQALDYVLSKWLLAIQVELDGHGLSGIPAIVRAFERMGERVQSNPIAFVRVVSGIGPVRRPLPALTAAEVFLLTGRREPVLLPLGSGQLLLREVARARADGLLVVPGTDFEIAHLLGGVLIGAGTVGHSTPGLDFAALYRGHVARVLRLDIGDSAGRKPAAGMPRRARRAR